MEKNKITKDKLEKYLSTTEKALKKAKKSINKEKKKEAEEIMEMVSAYLSDAKYFQKQGNFVNSFACITYAHGWLDSGVRIGIFKATDRKLFTIK